MLDLGGTKIVQGFKVPGQQSFTDKSMESHDSVFAYSRLCEEKGRAISNHKPCQGPFLFLQYVSKRDKTA